MASSLDETEVARARRLEPMERRDLQAQALLASLFLVAAGALLALGDRQGLDVADLLLLVVAMATLARLEFEIGAGYAVPTQLLFVPMLFVLPPAVVPLAVAAACVLARLQAVVSGRRRPQHLLNALGDAWFCVGPAVVFAIAEPGSPSFEDWPVYLLALLAQFAGDAASSVARDWLARRVAARVVLRELREVWFVDLLLTPIGLLAAATVLGSPAYLLVLPLAVLLSVFARERRARIDNAIELSSAYRGTALLLGDVLSNEDEYTGSHSEGVVALALVIADELRVDADQRRLVEFGAMLHDIGKITTPNEILNKAGPLTKGEWDVMRDHTILGQQMLDRVGGALHDVGIVVRSSHEHFDGGGYPDGLAGDAIPLAARIVAVADAYSAMTTRRSYRDAMAPADALAELGAHAGTQFDPVVAAAAIRVLAVAA